ncbi:hypothetical protein AG1IA_10204 [Rhizoctonia solani AG-1 IA]|uniref:Uncharacterized protein n=1 Tax=Thanatephorus cucumeris (strain AG1-IA) TaxID=983506 RepID=L8WC79_THACA|nr:hypothetical protein AG1IA_10204 [Rhizoctonia solani AG-1 IA]
MQSYLIIVLSYIAVALGLTGNVGQTADTAQRRVVLLHRAQLYRNMRKKKSSVKAELNESTHSYSVPHTNALSRDGCHNFDDTFSNQLSSIRSEPEPSLSSSRTAKGLIQEDG